MTKLKPCPFCGGEAKVGCEKYWQPKVSRRIICTNCYSSSGWYRTEEEAIELWNRRSENEELLFTRQFILEHGLQYELLNAWNRRANI